MFFIALLLAYLLGSVSFSYLVTYKLKGIDIRKHGSGNAGATNTLRVVGKGPAALVFLLDAVKGMAAVGIGELFGGEPTLLMATGVAAIIGHNWPVFLNFRGGKGIATTIGVTALLTFKAALLSGIFAVLAILLTRYVSLGSLLFATLLPILIAWMDYPPAYFWISLIITLLAYFRHRDNIKRLLNGTENRIGARK